MSAFTLGDLTRFTELYLDQIKPPKPDKAATDAASTDAVRHETEAGTLRYALPDRSMRIRRFASSFGQFHGAEGVSATQAWVPIGLCEPTAGR